MIVERFDNNPILQPNPNQSWEAEAVFNGCPAEEGDKTFLLYRAVSLPHYHTLAKARLTVADIGIAESGDGRNFYNRKRFIVPEEDWERFGCEDPRVTKLGGKYYIFYTALSAWPPKAEGIKVGLAISGDLKTIEERHLVTPFNAKAAALFPERIKGKIWMILTANTDRPPGKIALASFDREKDIWSEPYWQAWYKDLEKHSLALQCHSGDQVEVGAPPIKTSAGWLILYSYIRNYFSPRPLFTVEAVLLDLDDPSRMIASTDFPLLVAEEYYEKYGLVPNVVFPSGALLKKNTLSLYYGAADTTCCVASIDLPSFLEKLLRKEEASVKFARAAENPVLVPLNNNSWESRAVFNPAAIYLEGKTHLIYRAMSEDNTSVFGYATSTDGTRIDYRALRPAYVPREPFEQKLVPNGNSGCEDPRLTKIGSKIYMCYTAFDGRNPPRVALTWINERDFLNQTWSWSRPVLISPPGFDDKDAAVFPEKINGKYVVIHRGGDDMDLSFHETLDFDGNTWLEEYRWVAPRPGMWDSRKVGIASPPMKTSAGWLLLYHGVSEDGIYRVGALLLDLADPAKILGRTDYPLFEPETDYEKKGQIANVVFPCGSAIIGTTVYIYYGGADSVVGVATMELAKLLEVLKICKC